MQFVSCLQDLSSIEVKIQRADSPTSPRNNFFLPIGDDRERPRSPELLYPPIANITEVWTVSGFWGANHLLRLCFQTAHKGSNGRYRDDSGAWLWTIQKLFSARHLRARLRGLHARRREIFSSLRSFLGVLIYLRYRSISAVLSHLIWEVVLRVELPSIHLDLSLFKFQSLDLINRAKGLLWLEEERTCFLLLIII